MSWALLIGLVGAYLWYVRGGGVATGSGRLARYRRWMRRAPLAFGGSALAALALAGRMQDILDLPAEFTEISSLASDIAGFGGSTRMLKVAVLVGFGGGALAGLALAWWHRRRGQREWMVGKLDTILPRTRREIGWSAAMGVIAGVVEELFFRLALPIMATLATGSDVFGFALATAMFAYAHRYQGWTGMAFSTVAGGLLAILYLATGDLWFAMLVHALLNLNGLALRPALLGPVRT